MPTGDVKRTYRNIETDAKKTRRDLDGTDVKDTVGNAGDEARRVLGNVVVILVLVGVIKL